MFSVEVVGDGIANGKDVRYQNSEYRFQKHLTALRDI